jgi:hypothetical protein
LFDGLDCSPASGVARIAVRAASFARSRRLAGERADYQSPIRVDAIEGREAARRGPPTPLKFG